MPENIVDGHLSLSGGEIHVHFVTAGFSNQFHILLRIKRFYFGLNIRDSPGIEV